MPRNNLLACAIGAIPGIVPLGTYRLGHYELTSWNPLIDPKAFAAYAGLAFSLLTVVSWAANAFKTAHRRETIFKAIMFTALVETLMMTSTNAEGHPSALAIACLVLLISINAVANGCQLAVRAAATPPTQAEKTAAKPARTTQPKRQPIRKPNPTLSVA